MMSRNILTSAAALLTACTLTAADPDAAASVVYSVTTTVDATLTLPSPANGGRNLWRHREKGWVPLDGTRTDNRLSFTLKAADLAGGRTLVVLNCPDDVDLDDQTPPAITAVSVDGKSREAGEKVDLGGVAAPPETIAVSFSDQQNALVPDALRVAAAGAVKTVEDEGVTWTADGPRAGTATVDLKTLLPKPPDGTVAVSVTMDDTALDRAEAVCTVIFSWSAPRALPDGRTLSVDSVTDSAGWSDWWVLVDGVKMDESQGTTAGYTWLSQPNDKPHWVRMDFPKPRRISTVRLWWAYYQTYRTSRAYQIQILDPNGDWKTVTTVQDQREKQMSEHHFDPVTTTAVRVWQPPLSGQQERAEYMWLSEIEVE